MRWYAETMDVATDLYRDGAFLARRLGRRILRRPLRFASAAAFVFLCLLVAVNASLLQPGPHPAPFVGSAPDTPAAVAGDVVYGPEPPPPAQVASPPVTARGAGPRGSGLVAGIQEKLSSAGLYAGPLNGTLEPRTVQAIEAFQRSRGLEVTGEPSMDLLVALATGQPAARPSVETLAKVQSALNARGFGPVTVDGLMGEETGSAIRRFERSRGLPETGAVSAALLEALGLGPGA